MPKRNWKAYSSDLLQEYERIGLIKPCQFSLEGWNRNNFTTWRRRSLEGHTLYHCIFTCPVFGTHYPSGRLDESQAKVIDNDGSFWYKTERRARAAAAATAHDCLNQHLNPESCRCTDIPTMLSSGPVLPSMPYSLATELKEKRLAAEGIKYQICAHAAQFQMESY